jgi:hypothetical protein
VVLEESRPARPRRLRVESSATLARVVAIAAACLVVSYLIVSRSHAAFSGTTSNPSSAFASASVALTDDDAGSAMFNASGMVPGDTATGCIVVTYSGTALPVPVHLYGTAGGTGLAPYLDLDVEIGSGGAFGSCAGFTPASTLYSGTLSGFASSYTDYASGLATWSPSATPEARTFRFTVTLQDDDLAQGKTASAAFTWEAATT